VEGFYTEFGLGFSRLGLCDVVFTLFAHLFFWLSPFHHFLVSFFFGHQIDGYVE